MVSSVLSRGERSLLSCSWWLFLLALGSCCHLSCLAELSPACAGSWGHSPPGDVLFEHFEALACPLLQPFRVDPSGSVTLWCTGRSPQLLCHQQSAEGTLCASSRSVKEVKGFWLSYQPVEGVCPPTGLCGTDLSLLGRFSTHLPALLAAPHFASSSEGVRRASVESLAKAKTDSILCTPSIH